MKFLLELITCSGSISSSGDRDPAEDDMRYLVPEMKFLVAQEPPRRRAWRKHGVARAGGRRNWRPSLSSISEDVLIPERNNMKKVDRPMAEWRRDLKRKVSSMAQTDRIRSFDHADDRRGTSAGLLPAFAPTPFMF